MKILMTLLLGQWNFVGFFHAQEKMIPIGPKMKIQMTFQEPKRAILKYWNEGEDGFCERHAIFELLPDNLIYQRVTWIHPNNSANCSADPDMTFDTESWTHYEFVGKELQLTLPLGDKNIVFRFEKVNSNRP